jgi:hypothetical protein
MKMRKVLTLDSLAIVTAVSPPIVQKADAETACHRLYRICLARCHDDATSYACADDCRAGKTLCNPVGWYWFKMRSAASPSAAEAGVKDPSAAGASKLKASALATRTGAATATMPGAGAVRSAVTNGGVISTNGSVVTNSPVIVKRPAVATGGGGLVAGPGTPKLKVP